MTLNEIRLDIRRLTDEFVVLLCKTLCADTADAEYIYEDGFKIRFGSIPAGYHEDNDPGHLSVWIKFGGNYMNSDRPVRRILVARVRERISEFVNEVTKKHSGIIKSLEVDLYRVPEDEIHAAFSIALSVPDQRHGV